MPKIFYTDRDIEDLSRSGVRSLLVNDNVVVTDLAREKAMKLGFELLKEEQSTSIKPKSSANPVAAFQKPIAVNKPATYQPEAQVVSMETRVFEAVQAKLGHTVDAQLLKTIIQRVLRSLGEA